MALNTNIVAHLTARGYSGGTYNEILRDALETATGGTGSVNDLWLQYLSSFSGGKADRLLQYIDTNFFYTGSLIDKMSNLVSDPIRTNEMTRSEELDNADWNKIRSSITANALTSPDGSTAADKLVEDTTMANSHLMEQLFSFTSGQATTFSVYAKKGERDRLRLRPGNTVTYPADTTFDLTAGTVDTILLGSAAIEDVGDGWYRCSITADAGATAATNVQAYLVDTLTNVLYNGDGTSGLYLWGAQLEEANSASSYIRTTTAAKTRFLI